MKDRKITIVTVVYEESYASMIVQARSFAKYIDPDLVEEIIVIENGNGVRISWKDKVVREYGAVSGLVTFCRGEELADFGDMQDGWWKQQVLKLAVAKMVRTDEYLLLDCKHHLVKPLERSFIWDNDKLRIRSANYEGHRFQPILERALDYFGLDNDVIRDFPTTTPPFPFNRDIALQIQKLGERESGSLGKFMMARELTEFFLYSAYLQHENKLREMYSFHKLAYPVIWPHTTDAAAVRALIEESRSGESPFFGVHRRAVENLGPEARDLVAAYWEERGLGPKSEGRKILGAMTPGFALRAVRKLQRIGHRIAAKMKPQYGKA
jgi:hypothetical protein